MKQEVLLSIIFYSLVCIMFKKYGKEGSYFNNLLNRTDILYICIGDECIFL